MQIIFNNFNTYINPYRSYCSSQIPPKSCVTENNNIFQLPSYNQVDKSLINFCGKKEVSPLDEFFGGYKKEKMLIENMFLEPLQQRTLPTSLLLAFPDDYLKTQVVEGIKNSTNAEFIHIPIANDLPLIVKEQIRKAQDRYSAKNQPTILFIDDAEKAIGMTPAYAKEMSLIPMSNEDIKIIKEMGVNLKTVNYFKSQLDNIGTTTFSNSGNKLPLTILFATKNPQYIHPDLLTRDGKMRKIIFPYPYGKNAKEEVKLELINLQKNLKGIIENSELLPAKGAKQMEALKTSGKIKNFRIDLENIPYQLITSRVIPNKKNGAYTSDIFQDLTLKSLKDYIKQPKTPYSMHFVYNLATLKGNVPFYKFQNYTGLIKLFA